MHYQQQLDELDRCIKALPMSLLESTLDISGLEPTSEEVDQ